MFIVFDGPKMLMPAAFLLGSLGPPWFSTDDEDRLASKVSRQNRYPRRNKVSSLRTYRGTKTEASSRHPRWPGSAPAASLPLPDA